MNDEKIDVDFLRRESFAFTKIMAEHMKGMSEQERVAYLVRLLWHSDYVWGGEHLGGTDCSGSVFFALNLLGYRVRTTADYMMTHYCDEAEDGSDPEPGDLIFYLKGGKAYHVVVVSDNLNILNAQDSFIDTPLSDATVERWEDQDKIVRMKLNFKKLRENPIAYDIDAELARVFDLFGRILRTVV